MQETLLAFGRGIVKLLISLFVGSGVGLVTLGISTKDKPEFWHQAYPGGELFLAVGTGLLATGFMMVVLFFLVRLWKAPATGKTVPASAWRE